MARLISFPTFSDHRGDLTVMEKELGFTPKRVFTIYHQNGVRGGHGHLRTKLVMIALKGSFSVEVRTKGANHPNSEFYTIDQPSKGLFLDPEDWHQFEADSPDAVLLCICSEPFMKDDYFHEKP